LVRDSDAAKNVACELGVARRKKFVSEVLRKYDVGVRCADFSDTTTPAHNSTNLEAEISCAYTYIGPETEM